MKLRLCTSDLSYSGLYTLEKVRDLNILDDAVCNCSYHGFGTRDSSLYFRDREVIGGISSTIRKLMDDSLEMGQELSKITCGNDDGLKIFSVFMFTITIYPPSLIHMSSHKADIPSKHHRLLNNKSSTIIFIQTNA